VIQDSTPSQIASSAATTSTQSGSPSNSQQGTNSNTNPSSSTVTDDTLGAAGVTSVSYLLVMAALSGFVVLLY
jgi:hypothetical protein